MRDIHEIAISFAEDAAECLAKHDNIEIAIGNYDIRKREVRGILRILRADPRFAEVSEPGFLGYVRFKKAVLKLI
jgi:hypothetical protein